MEQLRWQNAPKKPKQNPLNPDKKNQKEMMNTLEHEKDKKEKIALLITNIKNMLRLKKETEIIK